MADGRDRRLELAIAAGLVAAVLLAFSPVLKNGFVHLDDPVYISSNPVTQKGLTPSTVAWAFTTGTDANWFPLTWLSVMLDVDLFGLEPSGHHAMSLGLHALSTALVFALMRRLGIARGPSAFAAALFGVHPLRVESVAWTAERKDVLSMALGLLTLLAYIRYAEAPSARRMASVTGLLLLGLMAKPMLVTLPFVLLLLDWWPLRRVASPAWIASPQVAPGGAHGGRGASLPGSGTPQGRENALRPRGRRTAEAGGREERRLPRADPGFARIPGLRLLLEKAPLFAVIFASCVVTYVAQHGAIATYRPFSARLENGLHSYLAYLAKFALPTQLACYYPITPLGVDRVALPIAALAGLTLVAWRLRATRPYLLVGWLWFLGTLVPMIGVVQVGGQAYADRYTYLPSIGLGFAVSLGLAELARGARLPRPAAALGAVAVVAALGIATWRQTQVWRDSVTLFEHTVEATANNHFIRLLLAGEYVERNDFQRAEAMLKEALAEGASPVRVRVAMSALYDREHREEDALREIDAALALDPDNAHSLMNRGIYLTKLGRNAEAVAALQRAIALDTSNNTQQNDLERRVLATAQRRLAVTGEDPETAHTSPR
jgi:tetratricopeptide (TPR) repeat protein